MHTSYGMIFIALALFAIGSDSLDLANSSYPIFKGNRERNNQINGRVCYHIIRFLGTNDCVYLTDTPFLRSRVRG
jgi:hypothetical protein